MQQLAKWILAIVLIAGLASCTRETKKTATTSTEGGTSSTTGTTNPVSGSGIGERTGTETLPEPMPPDKVGGTLPETTPGDHTGKDLRMGEGADRSSETGEDVTLPSEAGRKDKKKKSERTAE